KALGSPIHLSVLPVCWYHWFPSENDRFVRTSSFLWLCRRDVLERALFKQAFRDRDRLLMALLGRQGTGWEVAMRAIRQYLLPKGLFDRLHFVIILSFKSYAKL